MLDYLISHEGAGLFHDFELGDVIVDYRNKQIVLQLKEPGPPRITHKLKLLGVQHFQMKFAEPWGKGIYVVETDIEQEGSICSMKMLLNSGDIVAAKFERVEFDNE